MKTERYRLYVAEFNPVTAKIALDERYSKATRTHILLYRRGKCPDGYKEIREENLHLLPASDLKWVREVNLELMRDFAFRHRKEQESAEKKFLEDFERELQIEKQKLTGSGEQ